MTIIWNKQDIANNWPKRAVVTTGTPYGNKALHFGHIGGVFVPADAFARFLRDRLGKDNVRFVGGTDCFGSPINEGYRKAVEAGTFEGSISDYVMRNHNLQAETLKAYNISLDIFEGSNIGTSAEVHSQLSKNFISALYDSGTLHLESTMQFYDEKAKTFLNGRQVHGHCPVQGCKSEEAYADECSLGHQYDPTDLINPVSTITGEVPTMRPVKNWYFDLPSYREFLKKYCEDLRDDDLVRSIVPTTLEEFLGDPIIFVKNEAFDEYKTVSADLPQHEFREAQKGKQSFELVFKTIEDRDVAREVLNSAHIRIRTSKTLVPFRLTGNIEWGVKAPVIDDVNGLTVWCWPESLWQPISFTIARNKQLGLPDDAWQDFWCDDDAQVYQFLGQDNLYFYGVAQTPMFDAVKDKNLFGGSKKKLKQTRLIANYHLLFGKTKASSSGSVKPPSGEELLEHYTVDQLRCHFCSLGLGLKPVAFSPKPFDPNLTEEKRRDPRVADPALKEAALINNVFNRLARSCFYEAANSFSSNVPICPISDDVVAKAQQALVSYDEKMQKVELHSVFGVCDEFVRYAQKYWADGAKSLKDSPSGSDERQHLLCDCLYLTWISALMMHPFAPSGCDLICECMNTDPSDFFTWNSDFVSLTEIFGDVSVHEVKDLPPRFDFFPKHPSQFKK